MKYTNSLIKENSPYLLQHAHNPVDWYAWGEEALKKAKSEDKPILLSIGYSTCHWCHVMERESFEDEEVAEFMNTHFINIKLDREERPDLDQIYMEACQLINGSGGWPLNCFLLPDGKPFYAGTYFPPKSLHGRPSWLQVLNNMQKAYKEQRKTVEEQADKLVNYYQEAQANFESFGNMEDAPELIDPGGLEAIYYKLRERFDTVEGGFGAAPKFPNTFGLQYLFSYSSFSKDAEAEAHAIFSTRAMCLGGIYDHLKGGFARYTVDGAWKIPHFEKMLYDNALLLKLLATAYERRPEPIFKIDCEETIQWLKDEMLVDGLLCSALDADSEGVEGKFYVWNWVELKAILSEEQLSLAAAFYNLKPAGNWEKTNILWRNESLNSISKKLGLSIERANTILGEAKQILLKHRSNRIRPGLDDKQILSWNALMISALFKVSEIFESEDAENLGAQLLKNASHVFSKNSKDHLFRLHKNGVVKQDAFLEDYAFFIQALLDAYPGKWNTSFLERAKYWMEKAIENFSDENEILFYYAAESQTDLVVRTKEVYDSAIPSANSVMCRNLIRLAKYYDRIDWKERAEKMLHQVKQKLKQHPISFGNWADILVDKAEPEGEIAIIGKKSHEFYRDLKKNIPSWYLIMLAEEENPKFPLLSDRGEGGFTLVYICKNYACHKPAKTIEEAKQLLADI